MTIERSKQDDSDDVPRIPWQSHLTPQEVQEFNNEEWGSRMPAFARTAIDKSRLLNPDYTETEAMATWDFGGVSEETLRHAIAFPDYYSAPKYEGYVAAAAWEYLRRRKREAEQQ